MALRSTLSPFVAASILCALGCSDAVDSRSVSVGDGPPAFTERPPELPAGAGDIEAVEPEGGETGAEATAPSGPNVEQGPGPVALTPGETEPEGSAAETPEETVPEPVVPGPAVGTVEDSGVTCTRPALPPANQLPAIAAHPDPFLMTNGTRITTRAEWTCRRAEIKAQVEEYESGPKPAVDKANVTGQFNQNRLTVGVSEAGRSISFSITINRPNGAPAGPIPLLIGVGGSSLDGSVFSQNGVATANLDNNGMGAQAGGGSRGTGTFYNLYGNNHPASSMVAWAWGVSRIIDALEKTPGANIDPQRVAVTGCSRNGKGALTAGAFDERIALTIPQESGAGGSASWRVAQVGSNGGENVQTLSSAANEQPWFRANFGQNFGNANVTRLPFDHHSVMGMVAPRALLIIDNRIDWLGIESTFTAGSIANEIWKAFGLADHMGYWQTTGHTHCAFPASQRGALDAYVKKFLVGGGTGDTNLVRADGAAADLGRWMQWTPPTLQ